MNSLSSQFGDTSTGSLPVLEEVYESALAEHGEYLNYSADRLKRIIAPVLGRITRFEAVAREPLAVSPETAENIGTIWIHSGTGNYDQPFKPEDNPRLRQPWMGGWDRARIDLGVRLARKIAEARSGQEIEPVSIDDLPRQMEQTKQLIAEYGPTLVYSGYPCETAFAEKLLARQGIIPPVKVKIIHKDLKVTSDAVRTFEYPDDLEVKDKEVAIVSHAPHLGARVLHMLNHYRPLEEGSVPYMVPVATPDAGRKEFALMEARGLLWYIYGIGQASEQPYPYQLLSGSAQAGLQERVL